MGLDLLLFFTGRFFARAVFFFFTAIVPSFCSALPRVRFDAE